MHSKETDRKYRRRVLVISGIEDDILSGTVEEIPVYSSTKGGCVTFLAPHALFRQYSPLGGSR